MRTVSRTGRKTAAKAGVTASTPRKAARKASSTALREAAPPVLPTRWPAGTTLVVEGRPGRDGLQVFSRYVEFPNGTRIDLTERAEIGTPKPRRTRRAKTVAPRKGSGPTATRKAARKRKIS